jgi:hypothetical protein
MTAEHCYKSRCINTITSAFFILILQACAVSPQTNKLLSNFEGHVFKHQINNVPFYPQQEYFCGPTALSEVLNFYGNEYDPEKLALEMFIPSKKGSLQIEMVSLTRRLNFIPYAEKSSLVKVLNWVTQDIPVIVFQNLGLDSFPYWHYAVVIGFDLNEQTISLHTGLSENRQVPIEVFENTWRRSDYWVLTPLPVGKISDDMDPLTYIQAALDVLNTGDEQVAISALQLAHKTWPSDWLASFSLANYYYDRQLKDSIKWYQQSLNRDNNQPAIWNNYLYALEKDGCYLQAKSALACLKSRADLNDDFSASITEMTARLSAQVKNSASQSPIVSCSSKINQRNPL